MTIEEQITIFEHNAEHERKEGDLNNCLHFRQLAQWLKELQIYRRNLTNQSLSDLLVQSENENERLHNRINELEKELQNHKDAWEKVEKELKKEGQRFTNKTNFASGYIEGIRETLCKINEYRPTGDDTE